MAEEMSFPFPDAGVDHSHHWLHDGRPRHPEDGFPLNLHGITRVPSSQGMVSDTYRHNDAASHGIQGDLLAGDPWQPGQLISLRSSDVYHDHHAGQPQHDHRLHNDFKLSITGLNAFGPSSQALLTSVDAGDGALGRQQDLGFRPGGRGLSPRPQPPNLGSLYSMGQCGTPHDAGEAVFLQGGLHDSHVPRPLSVTPRPDTSGLSQVSGASVTHHESASLQWHGWCSIPYEPEPWSRGNIAARKIVVSSVPSLLLHLLLQPMQLNSVLMFQDPEARKGVLSLHLSPLLHPHLHLQVLVLNHRVSLRGYQTMRESPVGRIIWSNWNSSRDELLVSEAESDGTGYKLGRSSLRCTFWPIFIREKWFHCPCE